ncbi:MAG TPA: CHAT domain-containing protein [Vicinamibacterales bacterium]|nr:CHAT domain-containing protein [Vicinamibacterales bacterium]
MKRVLLPLAALLLACGCSGISERRLRSTLDELRQDLQRGDFDQAEAAADRGSAAAPADSAWAWTFRLYRAEILLQRNRDKEAEPTLTAPLPAGAAFDALRARQKYLLATAQLNRAGPTKALATLDEAKPLAPDGSDVQLDIQLLEGQLKLRLSQWAPAEETLTAAIAGAAKRGDRINEARGWTFLGMGSRGRGRWDEAAIKFERALTFTDLQATTVYAGALNNAGMCYARLGDFDRAATLQKRAVDFYSKHGRRGDYAQALGELGNTYVQQGQPERALPLYQQALTVAREANVAPAVAALWAGNLAAANIDLGHWDEADRSNEEARRLKTLAHASGLAHVDLHAAQIARGRSQLNTAAELFQRLLDDPAIDLEVRWAAHAGLADIAVAQSDPKNAGMHFESALQSIEKTRGDLAKTDFQVSFLTGLIGFYRSYVDALLDQQQLERALEIADSSRGRVLAARSKAAAPQRASSAALRRVAADSKSVLLSYWLAPNRSYLWVVSADGIHGVALPPASEIAALVREYKGLLDNAVADPLASAGGAGDRLYDMLVRPASAWIPPSSRVIVVADGPLYGLNFETLPVPGPPRHYWIEDVEVQIAPGLSMLAVSRAAAAANGRSLLLIGDAAAHAPEFPALKYAAPEIASVSRYFPAAATVLTGDAASPAAYKTARPGQFSFVHFTAHATTNWESPLDSAVILSGPDNAFKLYARDVAELPLSAELVTVSACRSAGERVYSGEGLVGFAWAFLRAGARRVIAGLWDVDDRSTAQLMDRLYAGIAAGHTPGQALRAAKLSLLAQGGNYKKPYYWGPFQLFTSVP